MTIEIVYVQQVSVQNVSYSTASNAVNINIYGRNPRKALKKIGLEKDTVAVAKTSDS